MLKSRGGEECEAKRLHRGRTVLAKAELRLLDYAFLREFPLDSRENEFLKEFTENRQERDGPVVFREALVFVRFRK